MACILTSSLFRHNTYQRHSIMDREDSLTSSVVIDTIPSNPPIQRPDFTHLITRDTSLLNRWRLTAHKPEQTWFCDISTSWTSSTADHKQYHHHVFINNIWRQSEVTPQGKTQWNQLAEAFVKWTVHIEARLVQLYVEIKVRDSISSCACSRIKIWHHHHSNLHKPSKALKLFSRHSTTKGI